MRFPVPAQTEPTDYARTPLCHRGPFWVTLADLPPTSGAFSRSGPAWSPPSEHGLVLFPSKTWRPASPSHERRRTKTIQHVRQRTPAPSLWPRKNMPSPCKRCRRGRPPSTANTPASGAASATLRPSGAQTPRRWRRLNATTRRSPLTSGQAPDSHFPPAPRRAPRPRLPP